MIILLVILLTFIFIFILNQTGFLYREKTDYAHLLKKAELKGAQSFEYKNGSKKAILFIHGFPGSPKMYYIVKEMAIKAGYDVYVPRLPGFGTNHKEFITTNFSMWYNFIQNYYNEIRENYDKFFIVGISMGGALTLKLTENSTVKPTAIASISAPVFLNSLFNGSIKSPLLYFIRYIRLLFSYIPPKNPPKDLSLDQDGDTEWVGYRGLFPGQIYSLFLGLKKIKKDLYKIDIPCYLSQAKMDKTVSYKNLNYIRKNISSDNVLIRVMNLSKWNHTNHSIFIYKSVVNGIWSDIDYFFKGL